ncbi:MAG TPA: TIM barrel protein [Nocardioides sp.]|jgi:hydroxypyruvate isomerase|uniref:hydroxypyruvate isomerase family protein n=1 Tax=Nocardioides sp. TaxID=35761 RepID=UPI002E37E4CC|nr:TIM barrel protein [Nocardioides sp.]HEX3931797.1 TIM barrel protein [Nocardioides sp.]
MAADSFRTSSFVANCSILFTEHPLLERPEAARRAGFLDVELWWPFPQAVPPSSEQDDLVDAAERAQVRVTGLNYFGGDLAAGERGIIADPTRVEEFRASVEVAHRLGGRLGCRTFNALYGVRSTPANEAEPRTARANLRYAVDHAAETGATVVLEPLSDVPGYPLRTIAEVVEVIDEAGAPANLGLQADVYHLASNGVGLDEALAAAEVVRHVQIADHPGRGEPGSGDLPLGDFLCALRGSGYDGRVALEFAPTASTTDSLAAMRFAQASCDNSPGGE